MTDDPPRRRRTPSLRLRTTAGAVLVVGVALLAASFGLVILLDRTLTSDVRSASMARAEEVAAALATSEEAGFLAVTDVEEQLIQVLDERGVVVASSPNVVGREPVATVRPGASVEVDSLLEEAPFLVVAAATASGDRTVLVARSLEDTDDAVRAVAGLLALGVPTLLVVVGVTTWNVVGRALRPVAAIRGEVERISDAELHRRVPQPAGHDEIADLARTMNGMLGRLDAAGGRQRRFVSDASHELRSPVASIRQHAEVALRHPERTTVPELAETVLAEDLRVQRLVENLLLLARSDEGAGPVHRAPVDLDDLVFEQARAMRGAGPRLDTSGVGAGRVLGVQGQLDQLVGNLLHNASRHADSTVTVSLGTDAGEVVLRVDDDGAGIPTADRDRVFERFVRLDEARARDRGGSGLGLAIVAEVVRSHGGTLSVGDAPTGGARVEVRLPEHG